jgi:hypothetical protein
MAKRKKKITEMDVVVESDIDNEDDVGEVTFPIDGLVEGVLKDETIRQELATYLADELREVIEGASREEFISDVDRYRRYRMARPATKTRNIPWERASNVVDPETAKNVNGIFSDFKEALAAQRPLFTVDSDKDNYKAHGKAVTRWLSVLVESPHHMNLRNQNDEIAYETVSLGTEFIDVAWMLDRISFKKKGPDGELMTVDKVLYEGPRPQTFQIEDFVTRPEWYDIKEMPWCGFWFRPFRYQIESLERSGFFSGRETLDKVLGDRSYEPTENKVNQDKRMGITESPITNEHNEQYDVFKLYVTWDVDGDGIYEEIIVWFHPSTKSFLRAEFNELGIKTIVRLPYFDIPRSLYAVGVCFMSEFSQEELDFLHNVRNNSLTASSLQMLISKRGSGVGPRERFFPQKHLQVDNPQEDLRVLTFPDVSGGTFTAERETKQAMRAYVGASEVRSGQPDTVAKSGTSGRLQELLAQQGNKVQRAILTSFRENYAKIGEYALMHLVANSDRTKETLLPLANDDDKPLIEEVLNMNVEDIPLNFAFSVKMTDPDKTEDAKRETLLVVNQLYDQYFQSIFGLLMQTQQTQQAMEIAAQYYVGKNKLMDEMINLLSDVNADDLLPFYKDLEYMITLNENAKESALVRLKAQLEGERNGRSIPELGAPINPAEAGLTDEEARANETANGEMGAE